MRLFVWLLLLIAAPGHAAEGIGYDNVVVVVVGISDYPDKPLPNATRDAERFADLFRPARVGLIELYDASATRSAIIDAIRRRAPAMRSDPGDRNLLVVYFVGHGHTADGVGFIAPHGARGEDDWLPMSRLRDLAKQSKVFRHQLYILGSCFGGDVLRSAPTAKPGVRQRQLVDDAPVARWVADALGRRARVALTAGSARQKVPDGVVDEGSPFGNALVNGLRASGGSAYWAADFNRDGCVSHVELAAYVEGLGRTAYNTPRSGTLEGDDAGTVVLCRHAFAPAPRASAPPGMRFRAGRLAKRGLPEGFVEVPAGSFMMGSPAGEEGRGRDEGRPRRVRFTRPLWVQAREVTQRQWQEAMETSPAYRTKCDDCPVERVSWYEAAAYANARSRADGLPECYVLEGCADRPCEADAQECPSATNGVVHACAEARFAGVRCEGYRLPTEAEWEYFARAGTTTRYSSGDAEAALSKAGWYTGNSGGETHPVGQKAANAWGLFDVHGNVREWCQDWYSKRSPAAAARDPAGPPTGLGRVVRGGSFEVTARRARSAYRYVWGPGFRVRDVGFRLVRSAPAP